VANFSEQVQGISATTAFLTNQRTGVRVPTELIINNAGTRVRLNPVGDLARNTLYRLTLTGGISAIRDVAGNPLVTFNSRFRVRP
jgi:Bacterial Ig-like domain